MAISINSKTVHRCHDAVVKSSLADFLNLEINYLKIVLINFVENQALWKTQKE